MGLFDKTNYSNHEIGLLSIAQQDLVNVVYLISGLVCTETCSYKLNHAQSMALLYVPTAIS